MHCSLCSTKLYFRISSTMITSDLIRIDISLPEQLIQAKVVFGALEPRLNHFGPGGSRWNHVQPARLLCVDVLHKTRRGASGGMPPVHSRFPASPHLEVTLLHIHQACAVRRLSVRIRAIAGSHPEEDSRRVGPGVCALRAARADGEEQQAGHDWGCSQQQQRFLWFTRCSPRC